MVQEYFLELFGEASPTPAIAPAPNVKYALFAQPVSAHIIMHAAACQRRRC